MFTGLIEEIGLVKNIINTGNGILLEVKAGLVINDMKIGDSVSINGACQTVTDLKENSFVVFVSTVTCSITTLGVLKSGTRVNLERAMTHESRFGGHIVQGHVDEKGIVNRIEKEQKGRRIYISVSNNIHRYIVEKGSIAVDGISLTVVSLTEDGFVIYLIPETLDNTIIDDWRLGQEVNIEVDILAKYIERIFTYRNSVDKKEKENIDLKNKLMEEGFM